MSSKVLFWPKEDERIEIQTRIRSKYGIPHGVGFIDGTLIPLYRKPELDGVDYYSRKGCYGLNALVVCDDEKRIRYFNMGWPGCVHDQRMLYNSKLYTKPSTFFADKEYVLGDSGLVADPMLMPVIKQSRPLTGDEERYNAVVKSARINVEHCFGLFKGRF